MAIGFSTKKIKPKVTLGDFLKTAREKKEYSLTEAESGTKVKAKFLAGIENGQWDILPQTVYVRGFVLAYARFLGLDTKEALTLFEREASSRADGSEDNLSYNGSVRDSMFLITPKTIAYGAFGLFVVTMFSYIIFQVLGFAGSPDLKIVSPSNNMVLERDIMDLVGITNADAYVTVNDENVPVTNEGRFTRNLKLHRGVNVITVRAVNKAQKESTEVYTVEYRPKTAELEVNNMNF